MVVGEGIGSPQKLSEAGLGQSNFELADILTEQQVSLVVKGVRSIQVHTSHLLSSFL